MSETLLFLALASFIGGPLPFFGAFEHFISDTLPFFGASFFFQRTTVLSKEPFFNFPIRLNHISQPSLQYIDK